MPYHIHIFLRSSSCFVSRSEGAPQWVPPERSFFLLYPGRTVGRTARVLLGGFGGSDSAQRHTMYEVCLYVTRYWERSFAVRVIWKM